MLIKLICCDVFLRPVSALIATSPHTIDVEYIPMLAHTEPAKLRTEIQARINTAVAVRNYDLFLLLYGLCGNATVGLACPVKMVMPRIHDCCAMFMGSKENFLNEFGNNLSMRWCTSGYYERGYKENSLRNQSSNKGDEYHALVELYGEDNANYVWDTMHPEIETSAVAYIRLEGYEIPGCEDSFRNHIEAQGKTLRVLEGDIAYLQAMVNGPWDNKHFLTISPGEKIGAVYDMREVVTTITS